MSPSVLAHVTTGFGNLGISLWFVMYGLVVVLGLAVLAVRAQPATAPDASVEPAIATRGVDAPATTLGRVATWTARAVGLFLFLAVLLTALLGDAGRGSNPAPLATFVGFYLLLSVLSMVLGDFWPAFSPFLTIGLLVDRARGRSGEATRADTRDWWVPALLLFTFEGWWTAIFDSHTPRQTATWLVAYAAVMLIGAVTGGEGWCRRNDPFVVVFGAFANLAPLGPVEGRFGRRRPLRRLATMAGDRRTAAVLAVVVGSILYDHASSSTWWLTRLTNLQEDSFTLVSLVALFWCVVLVAVAGAGTARWAAHRARQGADADDELPTGAELTESLSPALIPVTAGLFVAYALLQLPVQLQNLLILSSDPFGRGWDLFGTLDLRVDEQPLSPGQTGWLQVAFIGLGAVVTLVVAQRRLAASVGPRFRAALVPVAAFVLVLTLGGVRLVLGA